MSKASLKLLLKVSKNKFFFCLSLSLKTDYPKNINKDVKQSSTVDWIMLNLQWEHILNSLKYVSKSLVMTINTDVV